MRDESAELPTGTVLMVPVRGLARTLWGMEGGDGVVGGEGDPR